MSSPCDSRTHYVLTPRTVVFEIGRETYTGSAVSSTRGRIMAERQSLTLGPFRLDLLQSRLWRQTQPIAIRPQALTVLRYLVMHSDRLVTRQNYSSTCGTDGR